MWNVIIDHVYIEYNMKLTRLFTARKRIVWKEIIDTVYVIMYDQHSNAPAHLEKMQSWICLKISF